MRVLVIDEISYFSENDFINLDKKLRKIKEERDVFYGGVPIVLAGDFHQLRPCGGIPVYKNSWSECWHGSVNCCIFLKNDHRFKNDPLFGKILGRIRMGQETKKDIKENSEWINEYKKRVSSQIEERLDYLVLLNSGHEELAMEHLIGGQKVN